MEKKHYIIILITILIAVGLYINFTTNYDANDKFKDIVHDNETFIVGYHQMAPFIYTDKDGNVTGFDAELAQELCKRKGWKLILKPIEWEAKNEELKENKVDCIWGAFTINGRENQYTWSKPYYNNTIVAIVKKDVEITSLEDLNEKTIQVQSSSTALDYIENNVELALSFKKIIQFKDFEEAFDDLESGKCDMILVDNADGIYMIKENHPNFKILNISLASEQYGIGFQKENTTLRDDVQKTLNEMFEDGTVDRIAEKYSEYEIPRNLVRP